MQDINEIFETSPSTKVAKVTSAAPSRIIEKKINTANSAFTSDGSKPLAQLTDCIVVHSGADGDSDIISTLDAGDVVELYRLWKRNGGWIQMRVPDGSMGYMSSQTVVKLLSRAKLKEKETDVFNQPNVSGINNQKITKGTMFWVYPSMPTDDQSWTKIRLDSGQLGYIPSSVKVTTLAQIGYPAVETAGHDILVGAIWCIAGIAVTAGTYSAVADTGGTYFIWYGPVIFGGLQFLRGLFRAVVAEQPVIYGQEKTEVNA